MEKFVTQEECEERRRIMSDHYEMVTKDISKLYACCKALEESERHKEAILKWIFGIVASVAAAVILLVIKGGLGI